METPLVPLSQMGMLEEAITLRERNELCVSFNQQGGADLTKYILKVFSQPIYTTNVQVPIIADGKNNFLYQY